MRGRPPHRPARHAAPTRCPSCPRAGSRAALAFLTTPELYEAAALEFAAWAAAQNKTYATVAERDMRFALYLDTAASVAAHADPFCTVTVNNSFADATAAEKAALLGFAPTSRPLDTATLQLLLNVTATAPQPAGGRRRLAQFGGTGAGTTTGLYTQVATPACGYPFSCYPSHVDWTTVTVGGASVVTPVENQGYCGSCWAHSATAVLESAIAIVTGAAAVPLSREVLVDCLPTSSGSFGCGGGDPYSALQSGMHLLGGIVPDRAYPYTASNGNAGSCNTALGSAAGSARYPAGTGTWYGASASLVRPSRATAPRSLARAPSPRCACAGR